VKAGDQVGVLLFRVRGADGGEQEVAVNVSYRGVARAE